MQERPSVENRITMSEPDMASGWMASGWAETAHVRSCEACARADRQASQAWPGWANGSRERSHSNGSPAIPRPIGVVARVHSTRGVRL